jgi:hypothetical protein
VTGLARIVAAATLFCTLLSAAVATAASPAEERRIEFLIHSIEVLPGAQFIRNGVSYGAHAAADHLRLKRQRAGNRVATAEDFIRYCAATSSMSGVPYRIRFADGRETTSETFLRTQLANFRGAAQDGPLPIHAGGS